MSTKALLTVEQFGEMKTADTEDFELVEGDPVQLSSGTYRHNKIRDLLGHLLWAYFKSNPIGEAVGENGCVVANGIVRRPYLSIFPGERLRQIDPDKIPAPFAPDVAGELLSPSEAAVEVRRKALEYFRAGSKEVWILDHANRELEIQTAAQSRFLGESDVLETSLLAGFSVKVADLLA